MSVPAVVVDPAPLPDPAPVPVPAAGPVDLITSVIAEIDAVVEDALSGGQHAETDLIALAIGAGGAALELGLIASQTNAIIAAVATVLIPAVWRTIALVRAGHKAKVKAAAYNAAGNALRLIQGGKS